VKIRRIPDYAYFRDIRLVLGTDRELEAWLKRQSRHCPDIPQEWLGVNGRFIKAPDRSGVMRRFVLVSTKTSGAWLHAVLGHEVLHLTFDVLQSAGLRLCDESEEAFTYYFQSMFSACLKHLK
jgi:hypothetical protein